MKKNILAIAGFVGVVLFIIYSWKTGLFVGYNGNGFDGMYSNHMYYSGGGLFHLFWMGLFFYMIYRLFSTDENKPVHAFKIETAEDILKKKYASGEIQKDEFKEKLKDVTSNES